MNKRWKLVIEYLGVLVLVAAAIIAMVRYRERRTTQQVQEVKPAAEAPGQSMPAIWYRFFTSEKDDQAEHPEWGPVGGVQYALWETWNPAPGVYNWSAIDEGLNRDARYSVTLASGEVISKPVVFMPICSISGKSGWTAADFYDPTPRWVYERAGITTTVGGRLVGHVLTSGSARAVLPAYDSEVWREAWYTALRALGEHMATRPEVVAIIASTGLDTETQPIKDGGGPWITLLGTQAPGVEYRFSQYVPKVLGVYAEAFAGKTVLVNNAPGGAGMRAMSSSAAAALGIGLHNASLGTDVDSAVGFGTMYPGMWEPMAIYSGTVPTMWESKNGMTTARKTYWSIIAGLSYHPTAMDLHPEYFTTAPSGFLAWAGRYLGVNQNTTPGAWVVMRDAEYPLQSWGSGGVSGVPGDWGFYATRNEGGTLVSVDEIPSVGQSSVYARWARVLQPGETMTLTLDAAVAARGAYNLAVTCISAGPGTVELNGAPLATSGTGWQTLTTASAGATIRLRARGSALYVHKVEVLLGVLPGATPSPMATSASTATEAPTTAPTLNAQPTATIASTETPGCCHCCCCCGGDR